MTPNWEDIFAKEPGYDFSGAHVHIKDFEPAEQIFIEAAWQRMLGENALLRLESKVMRQLDEIKLKP